MIRNHFVGRIAELSRQVWTEISHVSLEIINYIEQVQDSDGKSSHYYAEVCNS